MSVESTWQASDAELLVELREWETRMRSTWAQMLSVVAEIDSRGIAGKEGYGTTIDLIRALARVTRSEARARVDAAGDVLTGRRLDGTPIPPRLPHTAAAVAGHVIGSPEVAVIRSILARLPPHISAEQRDEVEADLARHARTLDPRQLTTLGTRILTYLDQDGTAPKDTTETKRRLSFTDRDGGYALSGWLDREAADIIRSALSPLAAPRPATDTEVDLRDSAQRDADALVELAQRALNIGELPTEGGQRPQVVVTIPLAVL